MPETRFEDVIVFYPHGHKHNRMDIDKEFLFVCEENSIKPVSYAPSEPCSCGIKINEGKLTIDIEGQIPDEIIIKLSGIRKGRKGKRFVKHTEEDMKRNEAFWNKWRDG